MNYYGPRQMRASAGGAGLWHYTVRNDGHIYPIGWCSTDCLGHATADEACAHYKEYLLYIARYLQEAQPDTRVADSRKACEICGEWTHLYASIDSALEHHALCALHNNKEGLAQVLTVGESFGSY